jgi:hypothetical protein
MTHAVIMLALTFGLFLGMLLFLEIGRRIGVRRMKDDSEAGAEGIGAVDGAVFAVLGLLIAFTFSGATARFDSRRQLIVEETNDIGTAYRRLDLLPAHAQPALRDSFRRYWTRGSRPIGNFPTSRPFERRWPRPTSSRRRSGAGRWPPPGRKALRWQRHCCCSPRWTR